MDTITNDKELLDILNNIEDRNGQYIYEGVMAKCIFRKCYSYTHHEFTYYVVEGYAHPYKSCSSVYADKPFHMTFSIFPNSCTMMVGDISMEIINNIHKGLCEYIHRFRPEFGLVIEDLNYMYKQLRH